MIRTAPDRTVNERMARYRQRQKGERDALLQKIATLEEQIASGTGVTQEVLLLRHRVQELEAANARWRQRSRDLEDELDRLSDDDLGDQEILLLNGHEVVFVDEIIDHGHRYRRYRYVHQNPTYCWVPINRPQPAPASR